MSLIKVTIDFGDDIRSYSLKDDKKEVQTGRHCVLEFCHPDHGEIALFNLKDPTEPITNKEHAVVCAARQVTNLHEFEEGSAHEFKMVLDILLQKVKELDQ